MYEARQNKEKVSRRIDGGGMAIQKAESVKNIMNIDKVIQTYNVKKGWNNKTTTSSYIDIGKSMKSATDKIEFYNFLKSKNEAKREFSSLDKDYTVGSKRPKGKQGYYTAITEDCKTDDYWINWLAHATGDLPSMSVALLMGFKHGINIEENGNITPQSKLNEVCAYLGGAIDTEDDHYIVNGDGWKGTYGKENNISNGLKFSWLTRVVANGKYENDKTGMSEMVKQNGGYDVNDRDKVRESWLGKDYLEGGADDKIELFLSKNYNLTKDKIQGRQVTVLWIRKSGERGGAHYENDTSFKALDYYINIHKNELIILAGDKKDAKTTKLVETDSNRVLDLTEFWKVSGLKDWGGNTRTGQLRLYDYLNKISGNLKHIGSMSGGLEALALIGHDVKFKAKANEVGVKRMEQYQNNGIIKYSRIDFHGSHDYYNYNIFEKSAAKYFVFFSSGVLQGHATKEMLMSLYENSYDPYVDYRIKGSGLNGDNATTARSVSKILAKQEKDRIREEQKRKKKQLEKEYKEIFQNGNPNHRQDGKASEIRKKFISKAKRNNR